MPAIEPGDTVQLAVFFHAKNAKTTHQPQSKAYQSSRTSHRSIPIHKHMQSTGKRQYASSEDGKQSRSDGDQHIIISQSSIIAMRGDHTDTYPSISNQMEHSDATNS